MINQISISNFRGIKEAEIEGLGQVNLFIGKNNSGKSSILEALCLAKLPFKPADEIGRIVLQQLFDRRIKRRAYSMEELVYNYDTNNRISLEITFDKQTIPIEAVCGEQWIDSDLRFSVGEGTRSFATVRNHVNTSASEIRSVFGYDVNKRQSQNIVEDIRRNYQTYVSGKDVRVFKNIWDRNLENLRFLSKTELIDANFINSLERFERDFWNRMLKKRRTDKDVTSILNDLYETNIEHFTFSSYHLDKDRRGERDRFKLFSALPEIIMHIDDYGDGFRYAFSILTAAKLFNKRPLLIEEIESHQHPASLRKLIDTLIEIAFKNELQLFITTHSDLVCRYFWYHFRPEEGKVNERANELKFFHLIRDSKTGKVDCNPIDLSNMEDENRLINDIFELEDIR